MKVTLIVFAMLCSSTMGPGLLGNGVNGGLGFSGRHGINTGFGFNRFALGMVGNGAQNNGYLGYNNGYGKGSGYNNNNGNIGLNGLGLLGKRFGFNGFNSLFGVGFGKFGGVYH